MVKWCLHILYLCVALGSDLSVWSVSSSACFNLSQPYLVFEKHHVQVVCLLWLLQALSAIAHELRGRTVDAAVYVDRLDCYRVEQSDHAVFAAITRMLGGHIWGHTIVGLTRAQLTSPPPNTDYGAFAPCPVMLICARPCQLC